MNTNAMPSLAWAIIINLHIHRPRAPAHLHHSPGSSFAIPVYISSRGHFLISRAPFHCASLLVLLCVPISSFVWCLASCCLGPSRAPVVSPSMSGVVCFSGVMALFTYWYLHLTTLASHLPSHFNSPISVPSRCFPSGSVFPPLPSLSKRAWLSPALASAALYPPLMHAPFLSIVLTSV
ncbi:uncharacterized protein C8Q71DRAFT_453442 [Rhodofomes roseus]|uniref:Uncharacterized protein n=1 Tax=Rhodofomes roseus TaxID=34475 RepID=A0ABQ8JXK0_9APHY|nr:uncharacterized protein C8Q71DRAFT_453442 [Rhodofomes roseus]KAH9828828.1 hypothetical protein C8Q71DRAFT_453442 [Rhodofomes roseus]